MLCGIILPQRGPAFADIQGKEVLSKHANIQL